MACFRILSYNVRSLRDDPRAAAQVIVACQPHAVCLQEAPRFLLWRSRRRALARRSGLALAASARAGGLAVLTHESVPVLRTEHHLLRRYPGLHTRALTVAVLQAGARRLAVGSTHLDLAPEPRLQHAEEVLELLRSVADHHRAAPVLAGDLNEEPDGPAWRLLAGELRDTGASWGRQRTFTARRPRVRIDGVFADPELPVRYAGVPTDRIPPERLAAASDHRPVLVELEVGWGGSPQAPR